MSAEKVGQSAELTKCFSCGFYNPPLERFCSDCGREPTGQRLDLVDVTLFTIVGSVIGGFCLAIGAYSLMGLGSGPLWI